MIKTVLPDSTRPDSTGWDTVCDWPPDLFAAVATITEVSGLYSDPIFTSYWHPEFSATNPWIETTYKVGREWAERGEPPQQVQDLWAELIREHRKAPVVDYTPEALAWKRIVFKLLAIADEACAGIGFPLRTSQLHRAKTNSIQYLFSTCYAAWEVKYRSDPLAVGGDVLPNLPFSLCIRVPPAVACVQPKTNTPAVGCTLRSLSHHLALLPSIATVKTAWHIASNPGGDLDAFNVIVVPFPYCLPGKSFHCCRDGNFPGASKDRAFKLDPSLWVKDTTPQEFADYLCELIDAAKPELEPVHAIVLPEAALRLEFATLVAKALAGKPGLNLFLTGVVAGSDGDLRNSAAIYRFVQDELIPPSFQSKHHRWCLDGEQIRRYHLGHVLDPHVKWWEQIDVSFRHCFVMLFRPGATLSVLVCEDLARYDPVLTVMNSIGPNLVVALLMDGPQLERRWPGRYATVLADDPGSAVLTVTSLGMVARSSMPAEPNNREIALWKEPNGKARALRLPKDDHALLLTLTSRMVEQITMDGRGDGGQTVHFGLGAAIGIRHPGPPPWLGRVP
jgi:hypothetical protein